MNSLFRFSTKNTPVKLNAVFTRLGLFALALLVLVLTLPSPTHAAAGRIQPQFLGERSIKVILKNHTKYPLHLVTYSYAGNFDIPIPQDIPAGANGVWKIHSCCVLNGTSGTVTYQIGGPNDLQGWPMAHQVYLSYNNPEVGSNSYSYKIIPLFYVFQTGGSGNDATVTFELTQSGG